MDSLRQVSGDVAHDLRTPLSRLYQRLEDARTHASVADYEAAIEGAVREAEGLLETFSALLRIAQVEGASPHAGFRDVDLSVMAEAVVDAYRPDAEEAGHRLAAEVAPGIAVHGDQELLTQAVANLVETAACATTCSAFPPRRSGSRATRRSVLGRPDSKTPLSRLRSRPRSPACDCGMSGLEQNPPQIGDHIAARHPDCTALRRSRHVLHGATAVMVVIQLGVS